MDTSVQLSGELGAGLWSKLGVELEVEFEVGLEVGRRANVIEGGGGSGARGEVPADGRGGAADSSFTSSSALSADASGLKGVGEVSEGVNGSDA